MKATKERTLWMEEAKVEVCPLPLHQISLEIPAETQSDSAVRGTEPWPTNLRTSRYCLCPVLCFPGQPKLFNISGPIFQLCFQRILTINPKFV